MSGKLAHLRGFIDSHHAQASVPKDALQVPGSMTDLKNLIPLNKRDHAHDPAFPAVERNRRRDQIVGERKLMIKQVEEKPEKCFHAKHDEARRAKK